MQRHRPASLMPVQTSCSCFHRRGKNQATPCPKAMALNCWKRTSLVTVAALTLLRRVERPDLACYDAALDACARAGHALGALAVLREMPARRLRPRLESFLRANRLDDYCAHFRVLGVAFERDLLDITDAQLTLMVERHGLKILDRRRFDKAMVTLRRKLAGPRSPGEGEESGAGEEERHPIRVKKERGAGELGGGSE